MVQDITDTYSEREFGEAVDDLTRHEPTAVFEYEKNLLIIEPDHDPWNPLEGDHFGHMICFHSRYSLGDEHDEYYQKDAQAFMDWIDVQIRDNNITLLMLYLYDHSGITMGYEYVYPYNDRWDAGRVGVMYATNEDIRENWGCKRVTKKWRKRAMDLMKAIVDEYDLYLRGDAYGFTVMCKRCHADLDSTWGFFGEDWAKNGLLDTADPEGWVCPHCRKDNEDAWMKASQLVE